MRFIDFALEFTTGQKVSKGFAQIQKRFTNFRMDSTINIKVYGVIHALQKIGDVIQRIMQSIYTFNANRQIKKHKSNVSRQRKKK